MKFENFKIMAGENRNGDKLEKLLIYCFKMDRIDFLVWLDENKGFPFEMDLYNDIGGNDCTRISANYGSIKCIKYFIEELDWEINLKKDIKKIDKPCKATLLHLAAFGGHIEVIKYLVEKFEISSTQIMTDVDEYGGTPYMYACQSGNLKLVKYFDSIGCYFYDTYIRKIGDNAYDWACNAGKLNVIKYLDKKWNNRWGHYTLCVGTYNRLMKKAEENGNTDIIYYLRRRKYKRKFKDISSKNEECCICMEKFKKDEKYCICENGHSVHHDCFLTNLEITDKNCCVTCKGKMLVYKIRCM